MVGGGSRGAASSTAGAPSARPSSAPGGAFVPLLAFDGEIPVEVVGDGDVRACALDQEAGQAAQGGRGSLAVFREAFGGLAVAAATVLVAAGGAGGAGGVGVSPRAAGAALRRSEAGASGSFAADLLVLQRLHQLQEVELQVRVRCLPQPLDSVPPQPRVAEVRPKQLQRVLRVHGGPLVYQVQGGGGLVLAAPVDDLDELGQGLLVGGQVVPVPPDQVLLGGPQHPGAGEGHYLVQVLPDLRVWLEVPVGVPRAEGARQLVVLGLDQVLALDVEVWSSHHV